MLQKLINRLRFRDILKASSLPLKSIHVATSYYDTASKRVVSITKLYYV